MKPGLSTIGYSHRIVARMRFDLMEMRLVMAEMNVVKFATAVNASRPFLDF